MRKILKALILIGSIIQCLSITALADSCNESARASDVEKHVTKIQASLGQDPLPCGSIDLRSAPLGTKCKTSKGGANGMGAIFEKVFRKGFGESWRDPDGVIWSDLVKCSAVSCLPPYQNGGMQDAVDTCKSLGAELPSKADFERGEANGFREVLPKMSDHFFWSSSVVPNYENFAWGFASEDGVIKYAFSGLENPIRCVAR